MPKLAEFYGITIRMFSEVGSPHHRPHFHASYSGDEAVYAVDSGDIEVIGGSLPRNKHRQVMNWAEDHVEDLEAAWEQLQQGVVPDPIEPPER